MLSATISLHRILKLCTFFQVECMGRGGQRSQDQIGIVPKPLILGLDRDR